MGHESDNMTNINDDIADIRRALSVTPKDSPDYGHLSTILVGLEGERAQTSGFTGNPVVDLAPTILTPFPFPPIIVPRFMARRR